MEKMARRRQRPHTRVVTLSHQAHTLICAAAVISARAAWPLVRQPEHIEVSESPCDLEVHAHGALDGVRAGLEAGEDIASVAFYWLKAEEAMLFKIFDSSMDPNKLQALVDVIAPHAWCTGVVFSRPEHPSMEKDVAIRFESSVDDDVFFIWQEFSLDNDSWPVFPLPEPKITKITL